MIRIFGIALALENAKDGLLLIDEVENGLHYSVQPDVWRFLFQAATKLNVQVFATTHSYDCIKSFEGLRERRGRSVDPTRPEGRADLRRRIRQAHDLKIVVDGQIEVR